MNISNQTSRNIKIIIIGLLFLLIIIINAGCSTREGNIKPVDTRPQSNLTINSPETDDNQFTFNSNNPGACMVPCEGTTDPTSYSSAIEWSIDSMGSPVTNEANATGSPVNLIYRGLPYSNNDFGKKIVRAEVAISAEVYNSTVEVYIFFPKKANNHPKDENYLDSDQLANWFFYWADTACSFSRNMTYQYGGGSYTSGTYAEYNGFWSSPQYTLYNRAAGVTNYSYTHPTTYFVISSEARGIDNVEVTLEHEREHQRNDENWDSSSGDWSHLDRIDDDYDGDELPDFLEVELAALGFDQYNAYSFPGFPFGDDEEVWCEFMSIGMEGDANQDWANPGKQHTSNYY